MSETSIKLLIKAENQTRTAFQELTVSLTETKNSIQDFANKMETAMKGINNMTTSLKYGFKDIGMEMQKSTSQMVAGFKDLSSRLEQLNIDTTTTNRGLTTIKATLTAIKTETEQSGASLKLMLEAMNGIKNNTDSFSNGLKIMESSARASRETIKTFTNTVASFSKEIASNKLKIEELKKAQDELQRASSEAEKREKALKEELEKLKKAFEDSTKARKEAEKATTEGVTASQQYLEGIKQISTGLSQMGTGLSTLTKPLTDFSKASFNSFKDFEYQITRVGVVSRATEGGFKELTDEARKLGAETMFTSTQVATAMETLAQAGLEVGEINETMADLLNLALIGNVNLERAAQVTLTTLKQFGLETDQASRVVDVLSTASTHSNVTIDQLGHAMKYAGLQASQSGLSLEETSAILMVLGDAGLQGSMAGTTLAQVLVQLQKKADDGIVTIGNYGIALFDTNGKARNMIDIFQEVAIAMAEMTDQERTTAINNLTTARSMKGLNAVMGAGNDTLRENVALLGDVKGKSQEMADKMQETAEGAVKKLESAISELKIALGEQLYKTLGDTIANFTDFVRKISEVDEGVLKVIGVIALFLASLTFLIKMAGSVGLAFVGINAGITAVSGGLTLLAPLFTAFSAGATTAISTVSGAMSGFAGVLTSLVLPAIATVTGGGLLGLVIASKKTGATIGEVADDLINHFGIVTQRYKDMNTEHEKTMADLNKRLADAYISTGKMAEKFNGAMESNYKAVGQWADKAEGSARYQVITVENKAKAIVEAEKLAIEQQLSMLEQQEKDEIKAIEKRGKEIERKINSNATAQINSYKKSMDNKIDLFKEEIDKIKELNNEAMKEELQNLKYLQEDEITLVKEKYKALKEESKIASDEKINAIEEELKKIEELKNDELKIFTDKEKEKLKEFENGINKQISALEKTYEKMINDAMELPEKTYQDGIKKIKEIYGDYEEEIISTQKTVENEEKESLEIIKEEHKKAVDFLKDLNSNEKSERMTAISEIEALTRNETDLTKLHRMGAIQDELTHFEGYYDTLKGLTDENQEISIQSLKTITESVLSENAKRLADTIYTNNATIQGNNKEIQSILDVRKEREEARRKEDLEQAVATAKTDEARQKAEKSLAEYNQRVKEDKTIQELRDKNSALLEENKNKTIKLTEDIKNSENTLKEEFKANFIEMEIALDTYFTNNGKKVEAYTIKRHEENQKEIADLIKKLDTEKTIMEEQVDGNVKLLEDELSQKREAINIDAELKRTDLIAKQKQAIEDEKERIDEEYKLQEDGVKERLKLAEKEAKDKLIVIENKEKEELRILEKRQISEQDLIKKHYEALNKIEDKKLEAEKERLQAGADAYAESVREKAQADIETARETTNEYIEAEKARTIAISEELKLRQTAVEDLGTAYKQLDSITKGAVQGFEDLVGSAAKTEEAIKNMKSSVSTLSKASLDLDKQQAQRDLTIEATLLMKKYMSNSPNDFTDEERLTLEKWVSGTPKMATGGLVTAPTLSLVGEGQYPEAVLPLSDNVFSKLAEGIVKQLAGVGSGQGVVVNINENGDKIFKETLDIDAYSYTMANKVKNQLRYSF